MRKKYIVPEYKYVPSNGTFQMVEQSNFFCSKMLYMDNDIIINSNDLIYFQNNKGEQINENTEYGLSPITYNVFNNKNENHTFKKDLYNNSLSTTWILNLNIRNIFINHIFALFKYNRTFEGFINTMSSHNSVDISIREYINSNVFDKYQLKDFKLYVLYNNIQEQSGLVNENIFSKDAINGILVENIETKIVDNNLNVIFNQINNVDMYNFKYYFDLTFTKI